MGGFERPNHLGGREENFESGGISAGNARISGVLLYESVRELAGRRAVLKVLMRGWNKTGGVSDACKFFIDCAHEFNRLCFILIGINYDTDEFIQGCDEFFLGSDNIECFPLISKNLV